MTKADQYVRYYLDQQQGNGMPVFMGSTWQRGHGQVGYGLGGLFKSLGKIALKTGANVLGDVPSG